MASLREKPPHSPTEQASPDRVRALLNAAAVHRGNALALQRKANEQLAVAAELEKTAAGMNRQLPIGSKVTFK